MTKDLTLLIGRDDYLTTDEFIEKIKNFLDLS